MLAAMQPTSSSGTLRRWLCVLALAFCATFAATSGGLAQSYTFTVDKTKAYLQTNASPPVLDVDRPFMFQAQTCSDDDWFFILSEVSLRPPGRAAMPMSLSGNMDCFQINAAYNTEPEIEAVFPSGIYQCDIRDPLFGSLTTLQVTLATNGYPTAPFVVNYAAAQQINAAADFAVCFPPLIGGALLDTVALLIVEPTAGGQVEVFRTTETATATTTNVVIPAGTLVDGKTYYGVLLFQRMTDSNPAGGNYASASFGALTQFFLQTAGATSGQPTLQISRGSGDSLVIGFNSVAGNTYRLLGTADFASWAELATQTATQAWATFQVPNAGGQQFLRVVTP